MEGSRMFNKRPCIDQDYCIVSKLQWATIKGVVTHQHHYTKYDI